MIDQKIIDRKVTSALRRQCVLEKISATRILRNPRHLFTLYLTTSKVLIIGTFNHTHWHENFIVVIFEFNERR